jgi:cell wall assembly regulator SMI1
LTYLYTAQRGKATVRDLWERFEIWMSAHAPHLPAGLQDGATPRQIARAEAALQVRLPKDVVESYLIHDGQSHPECFALYEGALFNGSLLLPLETMVKHWSVLKELHDRGGFEGIRSHPDGPIRDDWWNPLWIPLTANSSGDHPVCVDLAPAKGGKRGQVISWWHADSERILLGPSFRRWFASYIDAVEAGEYVYSDEYGALVDRRDA